MLFDLRGRGRRRFVQAIYLGLAILMGGGLVLFGVGGATSGGLLDAFKNDSGGQSVSETFKKRISDAENGVKVRPTDPKAWANLTRVRFQQANTGDGFDQNNGVFTNAGKEDLQAASQAWEKYLTLTEKPDDTVASLMVVAYSQYGLNEPDKAVSAQEVVVDSRTPSSGLYAQLATYAYQAGQTRKAELASKKAVELAPKDDREAVKAQLDSARQAAAAQVQSSSAPASTSTPSS